jgi:RNA polymerase sigma-70 factor (ECF subfamily)
VDSELSAVAEFSQFYTQAVPRLVVFLRWQGAQFPDARDCTQEAMILAFQNWSSLESPYAWCRLVSARIYARRLASVREVPVDNLSSVGAALGADHVFDAIEQRHAVLRLLDRLPSRQRQIMAWTYDGARPSEIAEALQISSDAVRSTLHKARAALRSYLEEGDGLC